MEPEAPPSSRTSPQPSPTPLSLLILASLAVEAVLLGVHLVNRALDGLRWLDFDAENGLSTWFSSSQFLLASLAAAALAGAPQRFRARRLPWLLLAGLTAAMSVDETVALHEEAGERLGTAATLSLAQPVAAALVVLLLLWVAKGTVQRSARTLRLAAAVIVLSQACASVAGLALTGPLRVLVESVEDLTEMLAATLLLLSALLALRLDIALSPRSAWRQAVSWSRPLQLSAQPPVGVTREPAPLRRPLTPSEPGAAGEGSSPLASPLRVGTGVERATSSV